MYKLCFFVPSPYLEKVKNAVFSAGAGRYGGYEDYCWQTLGASQFRPVAGSIPFTGKQGVLETIEEYKVETLCPEHLIEAVVQALKAAHPYEEPAFEYWPVHLS